ncbi:MAG: hypothetical protein SFT91_01750 [Rickettsiaceae bacterium]|nr:hypothetical protein [Rickettsiaceae bacterium]
MKINYKVLGLLISLSCQNFYISAYAATAADYGAAAAVGTGIAGAAIEGAIKNNTSSITTTEQGKVVGKVADVVGTGVKVGGAVNAASNLMSNIPSSE